MRKQVAKAFDKDRDKVTDQDVSQFCGYPLKFKDMHEKNKGNAAGPVGNWSGKIALDFGAFPGSHRTGTKVFGINLEEKPGKGIRAHGYLTWLPLINGDADLIPVLNPPPACAPLPPPAP